MENTELYDSASFAPWNHNGTEEIVDNWPDRDFGDPNPAPPDEGIGGCPMCGSCESDVLGRLGFAYWVRCRQCGTDYQIEQDEEDDE